MAPGVSKRHFHAEHEFRFKNFPSSHGQIWQPYHSRIYCIRIVKLFCWKNIRLQYNNMKMNEMFCEALLGSKTFHLVRFSKKYRFYNPSVRVIVLVSHTTYVAYVNFIHKFSKTLHCNFINTQSVNNARNLMRGNRQRNAFCTLFWYLAWVSNPGFTSNKPTHYLLDATTSHKLLSYIPILIRSKKYGFIMGFS